MSAMEPTNLTIEKLKAMFASDKRFDGRKVFDFRDFEVTYGVSNKAEGSARVKIGKTDVVAGVKLQVGEPYPDSPDKGNLMVSGDLLPMASPRFESGPPGFDAIELPRLVDRVLRHSDFIDLSKLVITPGEKVWTVIVDIYPINDDGNLIDASTIAAVAALKDAFFPTLDKDGKIDYDKKTKDRLPLSDKVIPLSLSFFKLGDSLVLDPTREEMEACQTRITFGVSEYNGNVMINSCQKKDDSTLTSEDITKMMGVIPAKYEELSKKLKKFL